MSKLKKWLVIGVFLFLFYYIFIANILITLFVIASLYVAFKLYRFYGRKKLNRLTDSKELFRKSELGLFIALVAKVAKADGRVSELEAQLIGMMFDDISKVFVDKEKARAILKEIFNDEKQKDDVVEVASELNKMLGKSILKRRQYVEFLIQLAFVDSGVDSDEDRVLRKITSELNISSSEYEAILNKFENMSKAKTQTMSVDKAYEILGVTKDDDMGTIKKRYRALVRQYHPDIIKSQDKDEAYIEEATAKTQEINQAYQTIKDLKK